MSTRQNILIFFSVFIALATPARADEGEKWVSTLANLVTGKPGQVSTGKFTRQQMLERERGRARKVLKRELDFGLQRIRNQQEFLEEDLRDGLIPREKYLEEKYRLLREETDLKERFEKEFGSLEEPISQPPSQQNLRSEINTLRDRLNALFEDEAEHFQEVSKRELS